ncbi:DsbA family protein [Streptomyces olivaceus]|uniref:DsbA family protein n=1 Tax=Streptomyces olivaceus TaxID=47716 RepID=UPI003557CA84|nr:DsbA family protein [Streptomyces olivaceus]
MRHAREIDLDVEVFRRDLARRRGARRIAEDVDSAGLSGVSGTPTFFASGRRHHGAYDVAALTRAVEQARRRALAGRAAVRRGVRSRTGRGG